MKYSEILPSEKWREISCNFWKFEVPADGDNKMPVPHETMPDNTYSIVFIHQPFFKGIRLLGPQLKKFQQPVFPGSVYVGIRINPWITIDGLFKSKSELINQTFESPEFIQNIFQEITPGELNTDFNDYNLLEKGLQRLVEKNKIKSDPLVKYICIHLEEDFRIHQVLEEIPLSVRPVQKRFKSVTGISMADFRSVHRLQKTVRNLYFKNDSVSSVALDHGYTDHAHFINTFRKFMDSPVKTFLKKTDQIKLNISI